MANHVQGKNITALMKIDLEYYPIFCGKTMNLYREWEEIETTNIGSGSDRDFEAGMSEGMMEVTGVTILDNTEGRVSVLYLMGIGAQRAKKDWKIIMTADNGSFEVITFRGIIKRTSFDKNIPGYSNSFLSVRICGPVTIDPIDPPPGSEGYTEYSDYWDTTNGLNYIEGPSSGEWNNGVPLELEPNDIILVYDSEGTQYNLVTGTPTPGKREAVFNDSIGRVTFPVDHIFDGTQRVFINWNRPI